MDIKKLKAEFEKLKYIEEKLEYLNFDEHLGCYVEKNNGMPVGLAAWVNGAFYGFEQAAKAHEAEKLKGCVLVPVQCPDPDFADSLFDELSKKAIGEFGDDLLIHFSDIDEEKIWALMVEAAKAQAAPEGFILVDKHQLAQLMANMDSFGKKALGDDYVSFADIAEVLDEAREPAND